MKTASAILVLAGLAIVAAAQPRPTSATEQHFFNIEDAVQHPELLSDAELSALAADDLMRKELGPAASRSKLLQDGLAASAVHLCGAGERDIVVVGYGERYVGANVGPFWVIRDLASGPQVVLSEISLGLAVQAKRTNQCLNLQAVAATATESTTTDFSFNGDKYVAFRQKSEKLSR